MENFSFFLKTKVDFGKDSINSLSDYCKQFDSKKVLLVTDSNLLKIGLLEPIRDQLTSNGIDYIVFSQVEPNPVVKIIDKGAAVCKEECCDLIVAIGGGSSIDTAKGIAVGAVNEGSCFDYLDGRGEEKKNIINKPLAIIAIPTTSGTGSEVSMYSVITDDMKIKDSISSPLIYPEVAIVDPGLTLDLPKYVTACTGLDVLGHALEAYTSNLQNGMTNVWALEAIKIVFEYLPKAVEDGGIDSRTKMSLASVIAGSAMSHCGATIPHALGCPLSGHLNLPHGLTVGILQIPMIVFNKVELKDKFYEVVKYIQPTIKIKREEAADVLVDMINALFESIHLKKYIEEDNMTQEDFAVIVQDASIHGCIGLNKRKVARENIVDMYDEILKTKGLVKA